MKLCIVTMYGARFDTRVRYMAEILGRGPTTWVVTVDKNEGEYSLQGAQLARITVSWKWLPRNIIGWSLRYGLMVYKMLRFLGRVKPDIIQAEDADALPLAWFASRVLGCRLVYDAKELHIDSGSDLPHRLYRLSERIFVKKANLVIAANQARADYMQRYYNLKSSPVVVRNMPLQATPAKPSDRIKRFLVERGIEARKVVVYHGGIMASRGLNILVEAAALLPADVILVFIGGQTPYRDLLIERVRSLELNRKVFFMDRVPPEQLLDIICGADLGVAIYQNINLNNYLCAPTKQYEYVSAGVPLIMPDFPHLAEFLAKYDAGVVFDSSDKNSLAHAIITALDKYPKTPELTNRLARIREMEDWEHDGSVLLEAYQALR